MPLLFLLKFNVSAKSIMENRKLSSMSGELILLVDFLYQLKKMINFKLWLILLESTQ